MESMDEENASFNDYLNSLGKQVQGSALNKFLSHAFRDAEAAITDAIEDLLPSTVRAPRVRGPGMGWQQSRAASSTSHSSGALVHAKTAPPQELHFTAPVDAKAGQPVCLRGPHGDPIMVSLPDNAVPGEPCSIMLGPQSAFKVTVPDGSEAGQTIMFDTPDGYKLNTVVPPGKQPGDIFEICPPVVLVQVPAGVSPGRDIIYTTPSGQPAVVRVPEGVSPGHYLTVLLPLPAELAELSLKASAAGAPTQVCEATRIEALPQMPTPGITPNPQDPPMQQGAASSNIEKRETGDEEMGSARVQSRLQWDLKVKIEEEAEAKAGEAGTVEAEETPEEDWAEADLEVEASETEAPLLGNKAAAAEKHPEAPKDSLLE